MIVVLRKYQKITKTKIGLNELLKQLNFLILFNLVYLQKFGYLVTAIDCLYVNVVTSSHFGLV